MDFRQKYIKYKLKYILLKTQKLHEQQNGGFKFSSRDKDILLEKAKIIIKKHPYITTLGLITILGAMPAIIKYITTPDEEIINDNSYSFEQRLLAGKRLLLKIGNQINPNYELKQLDEQDKILLNKFNSIYNTIYNTISNIINNIPKEKHIDLYKLRNKIVQINCIVCKNNNCGDLEDPKIIDLYNKFKPNNNYKQSTDFLYF